MFNPTKDISYRRMVDEDGKMIYQGQIKLASEHHFPQFKALGLTDDQMQAKAEEVISSALFVHIYGDILPMLKASSVALGRAALAAPDAETAGDYNTLAAGAGRLAEMMINCG